jgi:hypothetical protein
MWVQPTRARRSPCCARCPLRAARPLATFPFRLPPTSGPQPAELHCWLHYLYRLQGSGWAAVSVKGGRAGGCEEGASSWSKTTS